MIAVLAGAVLGPFTAVYAVGPVAAVLFLPLLAVQLGVTLGLGVVPGSFTIPDKVTGAVLPRQTRWPLAALLAHAPAIPTRQQPLACLPPVPCSRPHRRPAVTLLPPPHAHHPVEQAGGLLLQHTLAQVHAPARLRTPWRSALPQAALGCWLAPSSPAPSPAGSRPADYRVPLNHRVRCMSCCRRHTGELQAVEGTRKYATRCPFTGVRRSTPRHASRKHYRPAVLLSPRHQRLACHAPSPLPAPAPRSQATAPPCAAPAARPACTTPLSTSRTAWSRERRRGAARAPAARRQLPLCSAAHTCGAVCHACLLCWGAALPGLGGGQAHQGSAPSCLPLPLVQLVCGRDCAAVGRRQAVHRCRGGQREEGEGLAGACRGFWPPPACVNVLLLQHAACRQQGAR